MVKKRDVIRCGFIGVFVLMLFNSNAQILKVDRADVHTDSSYWTGKIDFEFDLNNQSATPEENITFIGTQLGADLSYIGKKHMYLLVNQLKYFSTGTGPFVSAGFAHFRVNWLRDAKVSYENFTQIQYDRGRKMQVRKLYGGGMRFSLLQAKKSYMHAGIGVMYEQEEWKNFEKELINKNIWKSSSYVGMNMDFGGGNHIQTTFYHQTGKDRDEGIYRTRVSGDIALTFTINTRLKFVANFAIQYENRPIIPINNLVYSLTNGLQLRL